MTKRANQADAVDISKRIRDGFGLKNDFSHSFLAGGKTTFAAALLDTPKMFVMHMDMVLRKVEPQLTKRTRPLYDEMKRLVAEIEKERPRSRAWHPPMTVRISGAARHAEEARYNAKREQVMALLQEADLRHRTDPAIAAQEAQSAYRQAQSVRASQPRKLDEDQQRRISKRYWEAKQDGSSYGLTKRLAAQYDVTENTIRNIAKKHKPN